MRNGGKTHAGSAGIERVSGTIFMMPFAGDPGYGYASILPPVGNPMRRRFRQMTLPGHGERLKEPLLDSLDAMAGDLFQQIANDLRPGDVFFGHSMGALLAWLIMRRARTLLFPQPSAVVLSGMRAPSTLQPKNRHALPREALRQELRGLGGSPDMVLDNEEVFGFFEPQVRADFKAVETFTYRAEPQLEIPATVLIGDADDVSNADASEWRREFVSPPDIVTMAGGHFFILQHASAIRALLGGLLMERRALVDDLAS